LFFEFTTNFPNKLFKGKKTTKQIAKKTSKSIKKDKSFKLDTESVKYLLTNDVMNTAKNITTTSEFFLFTQLPVENIK
jgi:hypothetical protein